MFMLSVGNKMCLWRCGELIATYNYDSLTRNLINKGEILLFYWVASVAIIFISVFANTWLVIKSL